VRVLFSAETPLSLTAFQSVLRELGERGHEVTVAIHEEREIGWRDRLLSGVTGGAVTAEPAVTPRADRWLELSADIRSSLDLFQFLGPRFNDTYRARAWRRAPKPAAVLARSRVGSRPAVRRAAIAGLGVIEQVVPTNGEIERYLLERRPDVVLLTPYVGLRQIQPDFLRAAQALGLRTAICVKSWDNLSSKSLIRPLPERLFVWNDIQRGEAETLHGIPRDRIVVTGAQCFDEWFEWQPRPRDVLCSAAGLDPGRPFVLYACCAPWTGQSEVAFVRRWAAVLPDGVQVLVRPHPKRPEEWLGADLSDVPGLAVYPREGHAPADDETKADYFDSLYHSAALIGLNTSAMIEAAIVARPVLTVLDPDFERVQLGTIHFPYLLEAGGGAVQVAGTLEEHAAQLAAVLVDDTEARRRAQSFVASFVRPHGLDRPATPIFVDEVERLAASAAPRPRRTPPALRALRPLLAPLASRSARHA
jgi:hypothetical protein